MTGIKVKIDTRDLKEFSKNIDKLIKDAPMLLTRLAEQEAEKAKGAIAKETPVAGGLLRESWHVQPVERKGNLYEAGISNNVKYAAAVEYGHRVRGKKLDKDSEAEAEATANESSESKEKRKPTRKPINQGTAVRGFVPGQFMMLRGMKKYKENDMEKNIKKYMEKELKKYMNTGD